VRRLKEQLRSHVSEHTWSRWRYAKRGVRERVAERVSAVLAAPVRVLPDRLVLGVRERLLLSRPLDFDSRLRIRVGTPIEWEMRRHPAAKEPETVAWLEETLQRDDVLYDVGANIGAYSLIAAAIRPDARVVAIEPGYESFASLCANIARNQLGHRITPLAVALADIDGPLSFGLSAVGAGAASHPGVGAGGGPGEVSVTGLRLDSMRSVLGLPAPTHLKIDVDGSETRVLAGAQSTLKEASLRTILIEVSEDESDIEGVAALLEQAGFVLRDDVRHAGSVTHNRIYFRASASTSEPNQSGAAVRVSTAAAAPG
jgi:FkbM family methyltransferase